MEWNQTPGNHMFDVFDTIPLQSLTQPCSPQLRYQQPPVVGDSYNHSALQPCRVQVSIILSLLVLSTFALLFCYSGQFGHSHDLYFYCAMQIVHEHTRHSCANGISDIDVQLGHNQDLPKQLLTMLLIMFEQHLSNVGMSRKRGIPIIHCQDEALHYIGDDTIL